MMMVGVGEAFFKLVVGLRGFAANPTYGCDSQFDLFDEVAGAVAAVELILDDALPGGCAGTC